MGSSVFGGGFLDLVTGASPAMQIIRRAGRSGAVKELNYLDPATHIKETDKELGLGPPEIPTQEPPPPPPPPETYDEGALRARDRTRRRARLTAGRNSTIRTAPSLGAPVTQGQKALIGS